MSSTTEVRALWRQRHCGRLTYSGRLLRRNQRWRCCCPPDKDRFWIAIAGVGLAQSLSDADRSLVVGLGSKMDAQASLLPGAVLDGTLKELGSQSEAST